VGGASLDKWGDSLAGDGTSFAGGGASLIVHREGDLKQNRKVVRDAAEDAGALKGAERLFARMGRVASKEERYSEDSHASQNGSERT
jgi:hypothetical protein